MPWGSPNRHAALQQSSLGVFDFPLSLVGSGLLALFLRHDASAVTAPGDAIEEVADQGGSGHDATQTIALVKPIFDTSGVRGAGLYGYAEYMDLPAGYATAMPADNWTIWDVVEYADVSVAQCVQTVGDTGHGYASVMHGTAADKYGCRIGGVGVVTGPNATAGAKHLMVWERRAGVMRCYLDGVEYATSASPGVSAPASAGLVGALTTGLQFLGGLLSECAGYAGVLTGAPGVGNPCTGQLAQLWTYAQQWYQL